MTQRYRAVLSLALAHVYIHFYHDQIFPSKKELGEVYRAVTARESIAHLQSAMVEASRKLKTDQLEHMQKRVKGLGFDGMRLSELLAAGIIEMQNAQEIIEATKNKTENDWSALWRIRMMLGKLNKIAGCGFRDGLYVDDEQIEYVLKARERVWQKIA
ncbi:hypothetical protein [Chrysiogenes arsenatis]|uniref:hypothetical protein n=1 Tax=Chrysiogenes arsenatis TaxID=309797 RepID=UPI0004012FEF|nr:hypothetical protein [Chrysiogenes arsenatis]